ncbi:MAG: YfhO family protein [Bacteroidetes bacterium]|nr:YfhO family protein [Bacteroidota bacterium]
MAKPTSKPRRHTDRSAWEPTDWQCIGILGALTALFFLKILLGDAFLWEDFVYQWYPFRQFASSALAGGEIPLWNPYTVHGMPFLAEIQTEVFYVPMAFLVFLLKDGRLDVYWLELVNVLHYLLAGGGMYFLARSFSLHRLSALFAGVTFAFSGFLVTHAIHQVITGVVAWYPLLFLLFRKALSERTWLWVFVAGLTLGHSFFAGSPQMSLFLYLFLLCYFLFELVHRHGWKGILERPALNMATRAAVVVLLSLGIAMIQFLPTQELSELSARAQISYEKGSEGSLSWGQLLTLLVPKFFGVSDAHAYTYWGPGPYWHFWETCLYFGILPLILALLSFRLFKQNATLGFLAGFSIFAVLFSLGSNFILHSAFFHYVPGFASFRNPARMGVFLPFLGSLLSGFTLHHLLKGLDTPAERAEWKKRILLVCGAGAVVIVLPLIGILDGAFPFLAQVQPRTFVRKELFIALGLLAAASGVVYALVVRRGNGTVLAVLACGLVFVDLYLFGSNHNTADTNPEDHFRRSDPLVRFFKSQEGLFRVNSRNSQGMIMDRNQGMVDHIYTIEGYTPLYLQRIHPPASTLEKSFDLMNVRYFTVTDSARGTLGLQERKRYLPRAHMVFSSIVTRSGEESTAQLKSPDFDPWTMAIVEDSTHIPLALPADPPVWQIRIERYQNNSLRLTVETDHDGLLVLSETYYPGWKAFVDHQPAPIFRTNYAMRSVPIPRGTHEVDVTFEPDSFRRGMFITVGALCVGLAGIIVTRRRSRTAGGKTGQQPARP